MSQRPGLRGLSAIFDFGRRGVSTVVCASVRGESITRILTSRNWRVEVIDILPSLCDAEAHRDWRRRQCVIGGRGAVETFFLSATRYCPSGIP